MSTAFMGPVLHLTVNNSNMVVKTLSSFIRGREDSTEAEVERIKSSSYIICLPYERIQKFATQC